MSSNWSRLSRRIVRLAGYHLPWLRPSVQHPLRAWTLCRRSPTSASDMACGCMLMELMVVLLRLTPPCPGRSRAPTGLTLFPPFPPIASFPPSLSAGCFRAHPRGMGDEMELEALNERIMSRVNAHGRFFLSHTKLDGKFTMRVAIGNLRTTENDIRDLWDELQTCLIDRSV